MATEIKLPNVGENVEKAKVVRVLVKAGDSVAKDQPLIEIETEKATLEVPADAAGRVAAVKVAAGDEIRVGQTIVTLEGGEAPPSAEQPAEESEEEAPAHSHRETAAEEEIDVESAIRNPQSAISTPPAAPSVRRFAREVGVDINEVRGSGPYGRISIEDVKAHARRASGGPIPAAMPATRAATPPLPDFGRWGEIEIRDISNIRRVTAERLGHSWAAVVHVHHQDAADITDLENLRLKKNEKTQEPKLTVTAVIVKALAAVLKKYPMVNSSFDAENQKIILKKYIHIGVAVDTPRGLLVPVIRDVDEKSIMELAGEIDAFAKKARDGKLTPDDMSGGTFTVTNLGGIGGTQFNPVVNWPEVAILGVSRASRQQVWFEGGPQWRLMLPLCLGYDHRVVDGADAARFLRDVAADLTSPFELMLEI
ncbi:MAG: dihydrolipoamide acetyltransferase family protein [Candidatus Sumerlaeia bacterium]